jgi:uncharacterized protein YjbI with pentapeptide repeats
MTGKELNATLQQHKAWIDNPRSNGRRADLRGTDLRYVNFEGADLRWVDFRAADLSHAVLTKADCRHADFRGCNMRNAQCIGTNFTNSRLDGANLQGVDLRSAVMDYSQMAGVNLSYSFEAHGKQERGAGATAGILFGDGANDPGRSYAHGQTNNNSPPHDQQHDRGGRGR